MSINSVGEDEVCYTITNCVPLFQMFDINCKSYQYVLEYNSTNMRVMSLRSDLISKM